MRYINDGNFRIAPFEFDSIQELKIERNLNEHARLYVRGVAKLGWNELPVTDASEYTIINCEDDDHVYFNGVLQNVIISREDDVFYLEVYAVSHTIRLDTQKHKRSFQNNGQTYEEIVSAIVGEKGASVKYHANAQTVENILVQYDETDWEYAKRLASHTQDVLTPISRSDEPEFNFGVEDGSCVGEIIATSFSMYKDFDLLRLRSNDEEPLDESSITMFKVKTDDFAYGFFDVGEKVRFNTQDLFVRQAVLHLEQAIITCTYTLSSKSAITAPKTYNRNITGLALSGIVRTAANDELELDLAIDYESGPVHFFKYATGYSMESHTGWYVMPEPGDTVFLYFPTEDERDAYAANSVRQSGTDKTGDPMKKFLRTSYGKEIMLEEKEILISSKDGDTYIRINEDSGIAIMTSKPIQVNSGNTLSINSKGAMSITTDSNLSIATKKNLSIDATESISVTCAGNTVDIVPATGIAVTTDTQLNTSSKDSTSLTSNNEVSLTSANNMSLSSGKDLNETGKASVNISNSFLNSMSMNMLGVTVGAGAMLSVSSIGIASVSGTAGLSLSSMRNVSIMGKKIKEKGATAVEVSSGGSSFKVKPAGLDLKGMAIKQN